MRIGSINHSLGVELAFGLFLAVLAAPPRAAFAQAPAAPAAGDAMPAPVLPGVNAKPAPSTLAETGSRPPPGVPDDASAVTLELTSRPVAFTSASAEWADGFKSVVGEIAKVDAAIKKAGLTPAGHPFALFLATDDKSFQFEAMIPLAEKPEGKDLSDGVKIGEFPFRQGDQVPASRRLRRYRFRPTISSPLFSMKKASNRKIGSSRNILPIRGNQTTRTSKPTFMFFSSSFPEFRSRLRKPATDTHRRDFCREALGVELDGDATKGCRTGRRFEPCCG